MFSKSVLEDCAKRNISKEVIVAQQQSLINGFPYTKILRAAEKNDGIIVLSAKEIDNLVKKYDSISQTLSILKFVPASGAASRMFKNVINFKEKFIANPQNDELFVEKDPNSMSYFFENFKKFAFCDALNTKMREKGLNLEVSLATKLFATVIDFLITEKGLNYGNLPKGLIIFHKYDTQNRTAIEEHLVEAAKYACEDKVCHLHFTVSPEHLSAFQTLMNSVKESYEEKLNVSYNISYSVQKPSSDTVSLDENNELALDEDGKILFRPGGHGALIHNLNELNSDIVFIKNIDNVCSESLIQPTITYKKLIAAYLIEIRTQIFEYLKLLTDENLMKNADLEEKEKLFEKIRPFAEKKLFINFEKFDDLSADDKLKFLIDKLNRPIRVCGMVKNEGEPGGGPFWTESKSGTSLQIVESSQIDKTNSEQNEILKSSKYFNPVDLVVGLKNYKNEKFDLSKYIDHNTGFISSKSYKGKNLKALELPGLWNGAMSDWITIFVEVPIATFNPVKTVNDLLRTEHQ
jgi:hypothetical protein